MVASCQLRTRVKSEIESSSSIPKKTYFAYLWKDILKSLFKPLVGLTLLIGVLTATDYRVLYGQLISVNLPLFLVAFGVAVSANILCIRRWQAVLNHLQIFVDLKALVRIYAQGFSANTVLPGGTLSGDTWRAYQTMHFIEPGSKGRAVTGVLLDRISGLWGIFFLSATSGICSLIIGWIEDGRHTLLALVSAENARFVFLYTGTMLFLAIAPIFFYLSGNRIKKCSWHLESKWGSNLQDFLDTPHTLIKAQPISILIALLKMTSFWLCLICVGATIPIGVVLTLGGGIFLSAVLPFSIGGFGPRELGSMLVLTPLGFSSETILAGSILYGLTNTLQGVVALIFWQNHRDNSVRKEK